MHEPCCMGVSHGLSSFRTTSTKAESMFTGRLRRGHMILAAINMLQFVFQLPSSNAGNTLFALRPVAVPFPECVGCGAHRRSSCGCKDHMPHPDDRRVVAVIIVVDEGGMHEVRLTNLGMPGGRGIALIPNSSDAEGICNSPRLGEASRRRANKITRWSAGYGYE